jgi:peptide/nickel transport system permease protein
MIRYLVSRLVLAVVLVLLLISCSFGLVSLMPGDPARAVLGEYATPEQVAELHAQLGLDKPFLHRWFDYIVQVLHGDLGTSYFTGESITHEILVRLPSTMVILVPGLAIAVLLGVGLGTLSAYTRGRAGDRVVSVFTAVTLAVPEFALALALIFVFFQKLHVSPPPLGMLSTSVIAPASITGSVVIDSVLSGSWVVLGSIINHAVLPAVCLGIFFAAYFARAVRAGLTVALRSPQVEFARACGLSELTVYRYAMGDMRRTLLTYLVILFGSSLSGAVILESVFSWPGVGGWALNGILKVDIPVIQGFVMIVGTALLVSYVVIDVVMTMVDPRVRQQVIRAPMRFGARPRAGAPSVVAATSSR